MIGQETDDLLFPFAGDQVLKEIDSKVVAVAEIGLYINSQEHKYLFL